MVEGGPELWATFGPFNVARHPPPRRAGLLSLASANRRPSGLRR
jgi:hypothetical protein